ncbi:MAG TPA: hypothetical protein VG916_11910 [Gemmatimonadaceae bacterium]|nr:hypothetical protein [Gemmatimonadaceae bacterium]
MQKQLTFEHGGRTYTCTVETQRSTPTEPRWWFAVTGDQQRYSPIEATSRDTASSVKARIIEYYERHLKILAEPPAVRSQFGQPGRPRNPVVGRAKDNDDD